MSVQKDLPKFKKKVRKQLADLANNFLPKVEILIKIWNLKRKVVKRFQLSEWITKTTFLIQITKEGISILKKTFLLSLFPFQINLKKWKSNQYIQKLKIP